MAQFIQGIWYDNTEPENKNFLWLRASSGNLYSMYIYGAESWTLVGSATPELVSVIISAIEQAGVFVSGDVLNDYYTKEETYSKDETNDLLAHVDVADKQGSIENSGQVPVTENPLEGDIEFTLPVVGEDIAPFVNTEFTMQPTLWIKQKAIPSTSLTYSTLKVYGYTALTTSWELLYTISYNTLTILEITFPDSQHITYHLTSPNLNGYMELVPSVSPMIFQKVKVVEENFTSSKVHLYDYINLSTYVPATSKEYINGEWVTRKKNVSWGEIVGDIDLQTDLSNALSGKESTSNKTFSISQQSTHFEYPSAKSVYDAIQNLSAGFVILNITDDSGTLSQEDFDIVASDHCIITHGNSLYFKSYNGSVGYDYVRLTATRTDNSITEYYFTAQTSTRNYTFGTHVDNRPRVYPNASDPTETLTTIGIGDVVYNLPSGVVPTIDTEPQQNSTNLVTSGGVYTAVSEKEATANKVISLSSNSTDTEYPSAKCVYDIVGDIETLLADL